jgi:hypothetical protein
VDAVEEVLVVLGCEVEDHIQPSKTNR